MSEEEVWDLDATVEDADWIKHVPKYCPHCGQRDTEILNVDENLVSHRCKRCDRLSYTEEI